MHHRKFRVAVLGGGHLGTIHTRLLRSIDDVDLVGAVDPVEATRSRIAAEFGVATFADHRPLLGQIDAAIIAAPTEHHYWLGMELAEAGVHLLIEKPIAASRAEAEALIRATAARKLVLQVGHVERFNPAFTATAAHIRHPWFIEAVRASGYTFRSIDVGVVMDLMIHDIDLVLSLVGSEVVDVEAIGAAVLGPHEDMAHARLRFANGCIVNLNASRTSFEPQRRMQVYTDDAFVGIDFANCSAKIVHPSDKSRRREIDVFSLTSAEKQHYRETLFTELLPLREIQVEKRNAILDEQHDFLISIRSGQSPQVTGQQGRDALVVAEEIVASIAEQQRALRHVTPAPSICLPGTLPRNLLGTYPSLVQE
jgi:predicted dehydrogenase